MKDSIKLIVLIFTSLMFADSAVIFEFPDGRSVALTSSGDISMAAESVSIAPSEGMYQDSWGYDGWLPFMQVKCVFYLVNESDSPQNITVGFPIDAKFGDAYTVFNDSILVSYYDSVHADEKRSQWFESGLSDGEEALAKVPEEMDFTASADGEPMVVFYRTCDFNLEDEMVHQPVVAVWHMHFEPHQTRRLVNTYNTSWDYYGGGPWGSFTIRYVLTTGSTWKGSIGDAVITLRIPDELSTPHLSDTLQTCWDWSGSPEIDGKTVTWRYSSFEPSENLQFTISNVIIDPWECNVSPAALMDDVSSAEGDILYSAGCMIRDNTSWGETYHRELVLRILEAATYLAGNMQPPDTAVAVFLGNTRSDSLSGFTENDLDMISLIGGLREEYEADLQLLEESGYLEFLPLFKVKFGWDSGDVDMYASMQDREDSYLEILRNLEAARTGGIITDPAVEALYRLTGWYNPGDSLWNQPEISEALDAYTTGRI